MKYFLDNLDRIGQLVSTDPTLGIRSRIRKGLCGDQSRSRDACFVLGCRVCCVRRPEERRPVGPCGGRLEGRVCPGARLSSLRWRGSHMPV